MSDYRAQFDQVTGPAAAAEMARMQRDAGSVSNAREEPGAEMRDLAPYAPPLEAELVPPAPVMSQAEIASVAQMVEVNRDSNRDFELYIWLTNEARRRGVSEEQILREQALAIAGPPQFDRPTLSPRSGPTPLQDILGSVRSESAYRSD